LFVEIFSFFINFSYRPALELLKQVYEKLRGSQYWDELLVNQKNE